MVNCRPREQAAELNRALIDAGAEVVALPLLEVVTARDGGGALLDALNELDNFDWVVFTSTNAVRSVAESFDGDWPDRPRVGSVGVATTRLLQDSGINVHFTSDEGTAADLAESLPITPGQRVLAPLGDRAKDALSNGLAARGASVTRVEAYRTLWSKPGPAALAVAVKADYMFVTSPAIAQRLAELVEAGPKVICIGPTTAAAAKELGLDVVATATKRSPDGLISALVNTIN